LTFLWLIQLIWGFNFLKQSFNFIVSTYSVLWYDGLIGSHHSKGQEPDAKKGQPSANKHPFMTTFIFPYKLFITKHIGSVIACAFM